MPFYRGKGRVFYHALSGFFFTASNRGLLFSMFLLLLLLLRIREGNDSKSL